LCVSETLSEEGSRLLELIQSTKLTTVDVTYIMDVLSMQTGAMTFWTKVGKYFHSYKVMTMDVIAILCLNTTI